MSFQHPEVVAGAFIFNSQGQVLLIKSPKWDQSKIWLVLGGHIEFGESIRDAIVREVKEEVGLRAKYQGIITVFEDIFPRSFHTQKHFIYLECKLTVADSQKVKMDNQEVVEAEWWPVATALKLSSSQLHPLVRKTLALINHSPTRRLMPGY